MAVNKVDLTTFVEENADWCVIEDGGSDVEREMREECRRGRECGVGGESKSASVTGMPSTGRRVVGVLGY